MTYVFFYDGRQEVKVCYADQSYEQESSAADK